MFRLTHLMDVQTLWVQLQNACFQKLILPQLGIMFYTETNTQYRKCHISFTGQTIKIQLTNQVLGNNSS